MIILSIETSCDETAVSIIEAEGGLESPSFKVLGNALFSQIDIHKEYVAGLLVFWPDDAVDVVSAVGEACCVCALAFMLAIEAVLLFVEASQEWQFYAVPKVHACYAADAKSDYSCRYAYEEFAPEFKVEFVFS